MLKINTTVSDICIISNKMGSEGAKAFVAQMKTNQSVTAQPDL